MGDVRGCRYSGKGVGAQVELSMYAGCVCCKRRSNIVLMLHVYAEYDSLTNLACSIILYFITSYFPLSTMSISPFLLVFVQPSVMQRLLVLVEF